MLALVGGEWLASCPNLFTPEERAPDIHWIRGWMDPRDSLEAVKQRKVLASARNRTFAIQPLAHHYTS
jgi:hypothetical protein